MQAYQNDDLIRDIVKVFKDTQFPGNKIGDSDEVRAFIGKNWKVISISDINSVYHLFFFTKTALYYYLPAYMIKILEQPNDINPLVIKGVIKELGGDETAILIEQKIHKAFSDKQRNVILRFLERLGYLYVLLPNSLATESELRLIEKENLRIQTQLEIAKGHWR